MNTQLNYAALAAQRVTPPGPRDQPPHRPTLLAEAAPLLSIAAAIVGLVVFGATTVPS